ALVFAGVYLARLGCPERAAALRARAEGAAERLKEDPMVMSALLQGRERDALVAGDPSRYLDLTRMSRACFESAGDRRSACGERIYVGLASIELGLAIEAEATLRAALDEAQQSGLFVMVAPARMFLGAALARQARWEEARALESEAIANLSARGARLFEGI